MAKKDLEKVGKLLMCCFDNLVFFLSLKIQENLFQPVLTGLLQNIYPLVIKKKFLVEAISNSNKYKTVTVEVVKNLKTEIDGKPKQYNLQQAIC